MTVDDGRPRCTIGQWGKSAYPPVLVQHAPQRCSTPEPAHSVVPLACVRHRRLSLTGWRQTRHLPDRYKGLNRESELEPDNVDGATLLLPPKHHRTGTRLARV